MPSEVMNTEAILHWTGFLDRMDAAIASLNRPDQRTKDFYYSSLSLLSKQIEAIAHHIPLTQKERLEEILDSYQDFYESVEQHAGLEPMIFIPGGSQEVVMTHSEDVLQEFFNCCREIKF